MKKTVLSLMLAFCISSVLYAEEGLHIFSANQNKHYKAKEVDSVVFFKVPYLYEHQYPDTIFVNAGQGRTLSYGNVESNVGWTVSSDKPWLHVDTIWSYTNRPYENHNGYFMIYTEKNDSDSPRTGSVLLKAEKGNLQKEIRLIQKPYQLSFYNEDYLYNDGPAVVQDTLFLSLEHTWGYLSVYPNFGWKVLSSPEWIEITAGAVPEEKALDKYTSTHSYINFDITEAPSSEALEGDIVIEGRSQQITMHLVREAASDQALLKSLNQLNLHLVQYNISGNGAHSDFSLMSVLHACDMMSEDIALCYQNGHFYFDYRLSNREANYIRTFVNWETFYTLIEMANQVMDITTSIEAPVRDFVRGNCYAYRAFAYLYLIQLFQNPTLADGSLALSLPGVPLLFSESEKASMNSVSIRNYAGRNTVDVVFKQIEADLALAQQYLEGQERPNKNFIDARVLSGIAARYYLLSQQWEKAAAAAKKAYEGNAYPLIYGLNDGFTQLSCSEWMWGFDHNTETQTTIASFFSHVSNLAPGYAGIGYSPLLIDKRLYESIPEDDTRKNWFNGSEGNASAPTSSAALPYANLKFGDNGDWTMDYMYMRVAEMYLIEAEALAHQGKRFQAAEAIKPLMQARIKDWNAAGMSVEEIYQQRRIELWGEGFSYFDLKRLNKGIDRNYQENNHLEDYQLSIPAGDNRWNYQIPNSAFSNSKFNLKPETDQNP